MKRVVEAVITGAKPFLIGLTIILLSLAVATFLIAQLGWTFRRWMVAFVGTLAVVLAAGVSLHVKNKRQTGGYTLPGEACARMKRDRVPHLVVMLGFLVVAALWIILPLVMTGANNTAHATSPKGAEHGR